MNKEVSLLTLARRFRRYTNWEETDAPTQHMVWYKNNSSVGNRYISWRRIDAHKDYDGDGNPVDASYLYKVVSGSPCDWSIVFDQIYYGLIVGPKTLAAVEECLQILREDVPPSDDGTKLRHINSLGGVNWLDKPTFHDWTLTDRLGKILSSAFFEDRNEENLYSEDYTYIESSHSGWNRSM